MSPAQRHLARFALSAASAGTSRIAPENEGGQVIISTEPLSAFPTDGTISPARAHRERVLAAKIAEVWAAPLLPGSGLDADQLAGSANNGGVSARLPEPINRGTDAERATAQINLRLQTDLRRLRDIQSIELKIAAKREMLPNYADFVDGLVAAGVAVEEDVLPTVMIWRIDTGDIAGAMPLVEHVLEHNVPLPARYERSAPALIVEEIATAALKVQLANEVFDFDILARVDMLTADIDMHDQIRAKLKKAIGVEQMRGALDATGDALVNAPLARLALETFARARTLDQRVGVADRIKKLTKLLPTNEIPAQAG